MLRLRLTLTSMLSPPHCSLHCRAITTEPIRGCSYPSHLEKAMTTRGGRRLWIASLLCVFILTLSSFSPAQKLTAAGGPVLVKQLKNNDAKTRAAGGSGLASLGQLAR